MTKMIIARSGQIRLPLRDRKRDVFHRSFEQASKACKQFFARVDIGRLRNHGKNLLSPYTLAPTPPTLVVERARIARTFGWHKMVALKLKNEWRRLLYYTYINRTVKPESVAIRFPREQTLGSLLMIAVTTPLLANYALPTESVVFQLSDTPAAITSATAVTIPTGPANWVVGGAELTGHIDYVMGAHTYATEAGYTFAQNKADVDQLVASGTLVPLNGTYVTLKDVRYPYALPIVAKFVERLGTQYAEQGCGKLVATSGIRPLDFQETLGNGSDYSVHPTGMSIDLRRPGEETPCGSWLKRTLEKIEKSRRIDVTAENHPRHYHVVVVPHVYEAWLARQPKGLDPEVKWLATALYFEAAFNESREGYRAIGWVIRNRVRSIDYPNTILEVVAEGAAGRSNGGCQFSFMCDGKAEHIQQLCTQPNSLMSQYWLGKCDERWEVVVDIAKQILAETDDPTRGAVLYYTGAKPYWAQPRIRTHTNKDGSTFPVLYPNGDFRAGTIQNIGSHRFGCSNFRGSDACRPMGGTS